MDGIHFPFRGRFIVDGRSPATQHKAGFRIAGCLLLSVLLHLTSGFCFSSSDPSGVADARSAFHLPMANVLSAELVQKVPARTRTPPERFDEVRATPGSTGKDLELSQGSPSSTRTAGWIPPNYFAPEQLSRRPRLRTAISLDALDLPPDAASGTLTIQLLLSADGSVDEVIAASSTLPQPLVNSAVQAFSSASFEPGQIAGTPVRSQFVLEVRYEAHHP